MVYSFYLFELLNNIDNFWGSACCSYGAYFSYIGCMKTKPVIIIVATLVILLGSAYYLKAKYFTHKQEGNVTEFLESFNGAVKKGNVDSLLSYFEVAGNVNYVKPLASFLVGKTYPNGYPIEIVKGVPPVKFEMAVNESDIKELGNGLIQAIVPVYLTAGEMPMEYTTITLTLKKLGTTFRIVQAEPQEFIKTFMAYESKAMQKNIPEKDIYSPLTLKAFEKANELKSRYDSVIWFAHINKETYFYVVKGEWDEFRFSQDSAKKFKMGLVNPQLKEVIPAEFDLIHSIGATFSGLVEVEKEHKRGFYDLTGRVIVPVEYDQIFPVESGEHLAALRKGDTMYWLDDDYTVSEPADIQMKDLIVMLPKTGTQTMVDGGRDVITETNSRDDHSTVYICASYLNDMGIMSNIMHFKNPFRKNVNYFSALKKYEVKVPNAQAQVDTGWFQSIAYSIRDYFIDGREEFYDTNNLVMVDNKRNKVYGVNYHNNIGDGMEDAPVKCKEYKLKALSDTLFELKATESSYVTLYDESIIDEMPAYHYFVLRGNKLIEKRSNRMFAFTQFVNLDESYIQGCYYYKKRILSELTPAMLKFMKNEIYASHEYKFKDPKWNSLFEGISEGKYDNVDDKLTEIDKYNINWINQKLKAQAPVKLAAR